ncbi:MAG: hypothetical protein M8866_05465 [marine benthic group bacterium]|jgi:hypothetical protein|nr:hypothetical protein [Candidatus Benthicola marisminoris]
MPSAMPEIAVASLYQRYLVTRHTGRAVRLSVEGLVAELGATSLTVLDFGDVAVIDFSCADEVVAKLVLRAVDEETESSECFFLFRGVAQHHVDPMDSALRRRGLAAAAQGPKGEPFLIGDVEPAASRLWLAVCQAGAARLDDLAPELGMDEGDCGRILDRMCARRLLRRDGQAYHSLFYTFAEAERAGNE